MSAAELLAALRGLEELHPRDGEDANDRFERVAAVFHRQTGYVAPGKDCRAHPPEARQEVWDQWYANRLEAARDAIANASIDTGDRVLHVPSGETWLVAYVDGDRLAACGWPFSLVPVDDCRRVKKATADERTKLLHDMAESGDSSDLRARYARRVLSEEAA